MLCCGEERRRAKGERASCLRGFKYSKGELVADFESQIRHVPGLRAG